MPSLKIKMFGVVYFAAPIPTYETEFYDEAEAYIKERAKEVISVRGLYQSGAHFVRTYRGHVDRCSQLIFITTPLGFIGRGVFEEIEYFKLMKKKPVIRLTRTYDLVERPDITLYERGESWINYATVS